jgi:hypothetical protein
MQVAPAWLLQCSPNILLITIFSQYPFVTISRLRRYTFPPKQWPILTQSLEPLGTDNAP